LYIEGFRLLLLLKIDAIACRFSRLSNA